MAKVKATLGFRNMWHGLSTPQKFFQHMPYMFDFFDLLLDPDPDFVISSVFKRSRPGRPGSSYIIPSKKRRVNILYTPENVQPNMKKYDWAFSFNYEKEFKNKRQMRWPYYAWLGAGSDLIKKDVNVAKIIKSKTKFCAFVYSHGSKNRGILFEELSKYRHIDAPGKAYNNMPCIGNYTSCKSSRESLLLFQEKIEFLRPYKFAIVYENSFHPGYTTEKIYHAMLANCIPIYWGNPLVHRDFNIRSFINRPMFKSLNAMIKEIVRLDRNRLLYAKKLKEPWYPNNKLTPYVNPKRIIARFRKIFTSR